MKRGRQLYYACSGHEGALLYDYIYVSAGIRGLQLKIAPQDLIDFVGAERYPL